MRTLSFIWRENASLAVELAGGIEYLYVRSAAHNAPISVTLWKGENSGLKVRSQMHDIGGRLEVGVLEFVKVRSINSSDIKIDVSGFFREHLKVEKLVIDELAVAAESGITLENSRGEQIVIIASSNPHTLAIRVPSYSTEFEPEYPLDRYRRVLMV